MARVLSSVVRLLAVAYLFPRTDSAVGTPSWATAAGCVVAEDDNETCASSRTVARRASPPLEASGLEPFVIMVSERLRVSLLHITTL